MFVLSITLHVNLPFTVFWKVVCIAQNLVYVYIVEDDANWHGFASISAILEFVVIFATIFYERSVLGHYHMKDQLEGRNSDLTRLFGRMKQAVAVYSEDTERLIFSNEKLDQMLSNAGETNQSNNQHSQNHSSSPQRNNLDDIEEEKVEEENKHDAPQEDQ